MPSPSTHRPIVLAVLDGWGYSPNHQHNAIYQANTPNWDDWWQTRPHTLLVSSGFDVGLPDAQMGNSEVGHMHLGAGRVIDQDFTRINKAIADSEFFQNEILISAITKAVNTHKAIHVLGLLSPGGVHSHEDHITALIELAAEHGRPNLYLHPFLDGRDTPPRSAETSIEKLVHKCQSLQYGKIATLMGRFYAMDRDNRWDRIQAAYQAIVSGKSNVYASDPIDALKQAYARGENDEFVQPTIIEPAVKIQPGDIVIFMNFRADRARQLVRALTQPDFAEFPRMEFPILGELVTLTEYASDIAAKVAFPPQSMRNTLGDIIAQQGLHQLRIAETEKYAHVTFFFNGGREEIFAGEDRILIPSPKVETYDLEPEMSALEVTSRVITAIESQQYDVIILNFANADMVGHTGNFAATLKAIECLDYCLGRIYDALSKVNGEMLITADHGNAECMYDENTQQAHTAHTNLCVPFLYLGRKAEINVEQGSLIDIAPTILALLGLDTPAEMTGKSLIKVLT